VWKIEDSAFKDYPETLVGVFVVVVVVIVVVVVNT